MEVFIGCRNGSEWRRKCKWRTALYAKTDVDMTTDNDYRIDGNRFSVKTLDLGADWTEIVKQLNAVAGL